MGPIPERVVVKRKESALAMARTGRAGIPCGRMDRGRVGAAVVWWEGTGLEGRPYYLGMNKEVYDAEVHSTYRALKILEQGGDSGASILSSRTPPQLWTAFAQIKWAPANAWP